MNNKILYNEFCKNNKDFLIFYQPWWLDTVCGPNNWDVLLYIKNKEILGAFPYFFKKKFGLRLLITPKFSRIMGPLVSEKIKTNLDKSKIITYKSYKKFLTKKKNSRVILMTTKAKKNYKEDEKI